MFGKRLKEMRIARDLKQEDLAKRLGVTKQTISNWENGNITPALDVFVAIVEFFCTTPNDMLGYQDSALIDARGLPEQKVAHVQMIVQDMKEIYTSNE